MATSMLGYDEPQDDSVEWNRFRYSQNDGKNQQYTDKRCDCCQKPAVYVCRTCMDQQYFCGGCDELFHKHYERRGHLRQTVIEVREDYDSSYTSYNDYSDISNNSDFFDCDDTIHTSDRTIYPEYRSHHSMIEQDTIDEYMVVDVQSAARERMASAIAKIQRSQSSRTQKLQHSVEKLDRERLDFLKEKEEFRSLNRELLNKQNTRENDEEFKEKILQDMAEILEFQEQRLQDMTKETAEMEKKQQSLQVDKAYKEQHLKDICERTTTTTENHKKALELLNRTISQRDNDIKELKKEVRGLNKTIRDNDRHFQNKEELLLNENETQKAIISCLESDITSLNAILRNTKACDLATYRRGTWLNCSKKDFHKRNDAISIGLFNYIGRVRLNGDVVPGEISNRGTCTVIHNGTEYRRTEYEVLIGKNADFNWISCDSDDVPTQAVLGGYTHDGDALFVGRIDNGWFWKVGTVHRASYGCHSSPVVNQKETIHTKYEILVWK